MTSFPPANALSDQSFKVREVLPDDPDPEWVGELVKLCETLVGKYDPFRVVDMLSKHLSKRGEK